MAQLLTRVYFGSHIQYQATLAVSRRA
jgi:hypothetical protein